MHKQEERGRSRKNPESLEHAKRNRMVILAGVIVLAAGGAAYAWLAQQYRQVFFPNTVINGVDASGRTVEEVKQRLADGIRGYTLVLETRDGEEETIGGEQIDLHPEYDGSLEALLASQMPYEWGLHLFQNEVHTIGTMTVYDQEKLEAAVEALPCMDESRMTEPVNAKLSDYIEGTGYEILPEQLGTRLKPEVVLAAAADGVVNLKGRVSLLEAGAYKEAAVTAEDPGLLALLEGWNRYAKMKITYRFGGQQEVVDGDVIHQWLVPQADGSAAVDETKVAEFVQDLAKRHNTAYTPKTLDTSYGETVTITGGNYGWRIYEKKETEALMELLASGESQEREPEYLQTANSHEGADYGNTYVEINLTAQHLFFYKEGNLVVESDFVSGNLARGFTTPSGAFPLTYKQRNAILRGQGYESPVSYWMPFNGGIGMHDASWRNKFGGTIYKTNGSHGCINLPTSVAKTIYENIEKGVPVLCYNLDVSGKVQTAQAETAKPAAKSAASAPAAAQPTQAPAETAPAETTPETEVQETAPPQETTSGGSTVILAGSSFVQSGPGAQSQETGGSQPEPSVPDPAEQPESQEAVQPQPDTVAQPDTQAEASPQQDVAAQPETQPAAQSQSASVSQPEQGPAAQPVENIQPSPGPAADQGAQASAAPQPAPGIN